MDGGGHDELRWFRGARAIGSEGSATWRPGSPPGEMPAGVRAVVLQGAIAGPVQLLAAVVGGSALARAVDLALGVVVGATFAVIGIASIVAIAALARGSAAAWRLSAGPLDREVTMIGMQGWARTRLRTPEARRWFRAHAEARARRSGGPQ